MARVSNVPIQDMPADLTEIMREYDKELGGSEFVQVFAHAPDTFRNFINFYFPLVTETRDTVDMRLTELARLRVAQRNDCNL